MQHGWATLGAMVLVAGWPGAARALPPICLADLPNVMARDLHVPAGCELIDCCPGCPSDESVDWRVRVEGDAIGEVEVRIEGHESELAPLRLPRGETRLEAVAPGRSAGRAPLATLRVHPDAAALGRLAVRAREDERSEEVARISVAVEQWVGAVRVNQHHFTWPVLSCAVPTACDHVELLDNTGLDSSVLLTDGRAGTGSGVCGDDVVRRGVQNVSVGQLLAPASCPSEVAVFSKDDAAALRENVTVWTDACGDQLQVTLAPALVAPVTFHLAVPTWIAWLQWGDTTKNVALEDLSNASQLYAQNKTGIAFGEKVHSLKSAEISQLLALIPKAIVSSFALGAKPSSLICALPSQLEALGLYEPDRLNVYYLPVPGTGMTCADDRNVIFVALDRKPETLAHEFGHALSLIGSWEHTNVVPDFDATNLMWVDEPDTRDHISLGQAFRMNFEKQSMLNVNPVRSGPTRACPTEPPPHPDPSKCPSLGLDWARP